ncbi:MAG: type II toxin-antitoxin system HicB family antitoxin [Candidatus Aenigmarchaeota archaeon]|nr:type II toxin-antitoxin system HicB family antitoxin [Candidatus Aenigmarchaeota archaeon]
MNIASQGKTQKEALKNLKEALELYLEDEDAKIPARNFEPVLTFVRVDGFCHTTRF